MLRQTWEGALTDPRASYTEPLRDVPVDREPTIDGVAAMEHWDMGRALRRALRQLDPELELLVRLRYGLGGTRPLTLQQLGYLTCRSPERMRQRLAGALRLMRRRGRATGIEDYAPIDAPGRWR